jgi:hypothetical protein
MKKAGWMLAGLLFISSQSWAQISLSSSDLPTAGTTSLLADQVFTGETPSAGSNQTWSFPEADTSFFDTVSYIAASATPFGNQIPNANLATGGFGSYFFLKNTPSTYSIEGLVFELPPLPINVPFTSAVFPLSSSIRIFNFPATNGQNLRSTATANFAFPFDTTITINGLQANITQARIVATVTDTSLINGFGTAEFAGGTFPVLRNEMRLKMTFKIQVFAAILIFPPTWIDLPANLLPAGGLPELYTKSVEFWTNGKQAPLASFTLDSLDNIESASYLKDVLYTRNRSLLSARPEFEFTMYPNPAQQFLHLEGPAKAVQARIFSSDGKVLKEFAVDADEKALNLATLPNGLYWVELETSDQKRSGKQLIINR